MTVPLYVGTLDELRPDLEALVKRDALGRASPDDSAWLREPDHLDEWRDCLIRLAQHTQADQTVSRSRIEAARVSRDPLAYRQAMKAHAEWAGRAAHFRQKVEARLRECKRLIRKREQAANDEYRAHLETRVRLLEAEVRRIAVAAGAGEGAER